MYDKHQPDDRVFVYGENIEEMTQPGVYEVNKQEKILNLSNLFQTEMSFLLI